MAKSGKQSIGKTQKALDELFKYPPESLDAFKNRLAAVDKTTARRLLVDKLADNNLTPAERPVFLGALELLGPGRQKSRLMGMLNDSDLSAFQRITAFFAVGVENHDDPQAIVNGFDQEMLLAMSDFSLEEIFRVEDSEIGPGVCAALLGSQDVETALVILEQMERHRSMARVFAHTAYVEALAEPDLAGLHPALLDLVVEEAHPLGVALLEELVAQTAEKTARQAMQKAVLKARTKMSQPPKEQAVPPGHALVSSCDGQGAVFIAACLDNPDGSVTFASVCARLGHDIRDGALMPRITKKEMNQILDHCRANASVEFVEVTIPQAAGFVHAAVANTPAEKIAMDPDTSKAVACFPATEPGETPKAAPLARVKCSMDLAMKILDSPIYSAWFFDRGDFANAGLNPAEADDNEIWLDLAAEKLNTPPIRERLAAMAGHMAWWHRQARDREQEAIFQTVADEVEKDFAGSPFVRAMVRKSLVINAVMDIAKEEGLLEIGDPELRHFLRSEIFGHVTAPTGRDLALLDFTEAAYVALDESFLGLFSDGEPRSDELPAMAHVVAQKVVDYLLSKKKSRAADLKTGLTLALVNDFKLGRKDVKVIFEEVVEDLMMFKQDLCDSCLVGCLKRPKKNVADVFFGPAHPGLGTAFD